LRNPNSHIKKAIYKITSPSGKVYIGLTSNYNKRWYDYKGLRVKSQLLIYRSLIKYGWANHKFEIVHEFPSHSDKKVLMEMEKYYVREYKRAGYTLLNLTEGGEGSGISEEARQKKSEYMKNRIVSEETKNKISNSLKGRKVPPEVLAKRIGKTHSEEHKRKIRLAGIGRKMSEQSKKKLSDSKKKYKFTEEHIANIRKAKSVTKHSI
jgi:group I intron endonuclease